MVFIPLYDDNPFRHLPRPYVNYALIAVTIASFFLTGGLDEYAVQSAAMQYGFIPSAAGGLEVLGPEYKRIPEKATYLTYAFLHANWAHLLGNMAFLWVFGDNVEDALGHFRYLVFYLLCAAATAFIHAFADQASPLPLVGASGAVAGVVGAYLLLYPRAKLWMLAFGRIPLRLPAMIVIGAWGALPGLQPRLLDARRVGRLVGACRRACRRARFSSSPCAAAACRSSTGGRRNRASVALQQKPSPCRLIRRAVAFSACPRGSGEKAA